MLFTRKLITKFIPAFNTISNELFVHVINALGMEVESIYKYPEVNNIVVGRLASFKPIEGTHLNLCQVEVGPQQTNTIVCGASGLKEGAYVLVALEGAKLPNGITIAKRMIHGYESNGMMCAYSELTGNDACVADVEQDEIIMLDQGTVGSNKWRELIGLDDEIYDITLPANRNDENSYLVFCYELAHKLELEFKENISFETTAVEGIVNSLPVDQSVCSFLGFIDFNINQSNLERSDWQMKSLLMNHGIKPINKLLDQLAYITLLTNCPTHVYNVDKLSGQLGCKLASGGEKFIALNSKTFELTNKDIIIYDQNKPVSIAAVIGSDETKLTNETKTVRIEVGNFNYANVRTTAIRLNCETDASKKAARPLSTYLNLLTVSLINRIFGKAIKQEIWYKPNWNTKPITLNWYTLSWFINEHLSKSFVIESLRKLGYTSKWYARNRLTAPAWRLDVERQEDMFEDVLKIVDMNQLKSISISDKLIPLTNNQSYELKTSIKDILLNNYFSEVKTYNLVNKSVVNKFNLFNNSNPIRIISNNANREYFRMSLIDNMLKVYKYNDARKLDLIPIFELQKLFTNNKKWTDLTCLSLEKHVIDNITHSEIKLNVNFYKAIVLKIAQLLNVDLTFKPVTVDSLYENESIGVYYNDTIVGYIGKIKSSVLKDYDLNNKQIYLLTLEISSLFAQYKQTSFKVKQFGVFQKISKDVNISLTKENINQLNSKIENIKKIPNISDANVINVFNKDNITVYTVRYYLTDTKQFTSNDLDNIARTIEEQIK